MARVTLDIDTAVLLDLKRLREREHKPLGQLVSELVAQALAERAAPSDGASFSWISKPMEARLDPGDKQAISSVLDDANDAP